jgi:O-antigen ligase/polysaccharide polymerase Wzy-like membrane protein
MGAGRRGALAIGVALALVVLIEAYALRAETLGVVVVVALAVLGLIVVVAGADLVRVGIGATYLAAFTLTWNGWFVGPLRPGDALIPVALMCFAAGAPITVLRTPPWWIKQLCLALVLGVVLVVLFPPEPAYLVQRIVLSATGEPVYRSIDGIAAQNIGVAVKFIIAVGAIPVAFAASAQLDRRALYRLGIVFCAGAALNGAVAFVDHTGVASIGHYLTHVPNLSARQLGFANHPNFLAAGLVLAVPFACWLLVSASRWERWLGAASLLSQLLGVYATGSRGGAVCAVGAVVLSFALLPRTRPHLPAIVLGAVAGAVAVAALFPSFGLAILRVTRLAGNPTTTGSDIVRAKVADQGMADFHYSPIHGIGLQASTDASQVYIQELASGGLILFLAMSAYMAGAAWDAWRFVDRDPLAAAILASVLATLALNVFEADLTDRFYYVPEAILVAMIVVARRADADPPAPVAEEPVRVTA